MTEIEKIIERINTKNNSEIFDSKNISEVEKFLSTLGPLTYIGHGGLSFCFSRNNKEVIKCCKKNKGTIVTSKDLFLSNVQKLREIHMPILYPYEVLFENDSWLIYSQPLCRCIAWSEISLKMTCQILNFVGQMIKTNVRISDIFYKNFGIYHNKMYLFDYHEVDNFHSSSNFLITNLYSTFTFLGKNLNWPVLDIGLINLDFVIKDNFGKGRFPDPLSRCLQYMHGKNYSKAVEQIEIAKSYIKKKINRKYTKYQHMNIDENGTLDLFSHTLIKYEIAYNLIKEKVPSTVLDARCCLGGIGLKLAQDFPDLNIHLANPDTDELNKTKQLSTDCMIFNTTFIPDQLSEIKSIRNTKYDLVIYYSLFHHLLKTLPIDEIIRRAKLQIGKYCIIEVPMRGDALLNRVMKLGTTVENFQCLASPDTFRYYLILHRLKVNRCIRINYGDSRLNRYAYVCSI